MIPQPTNDERPADAGETLVEVLITILIVSIVFVALMAGFGTSIGISVLHRQQATGQTIARDFGEYIAYNNAVPYDTSCPASYSAAVSSFDSTYTLPDNSHPLAPGSPTYTILITGVDYISSYSSLTQQEDFSGSCSAHLGVQRISFTVTSMQNPNVVQTLQVVKRQ